MGLAVKAGLEHVGTSGPQALVEAPMSAAAGKREADGCVRCGAIIEPGGKAVGLGGGGVRAGGGIAIDAAAAAVSAAPDAVTGIERGCLLAIDRSEGIGCRPLLLGIADRAKAAAIEMPIERGIEQQIEERVAGLERHLGEARAELARDLGQPGGRQRAEDRGDAAIDVERVD